MSLSRTALYAPLRALSVVGLFACCTAMQADDAVGTWDLTSEFGGQVQESTLTITKNGDDLEATIVGDQGELELEGVEFSDGRIEFLANIETGGQEIALSFAGTIDGDELEGNWTSDFGDFPVSGKRSGGGDAPSFVGTWDLMVDSQLGNNARKLVVNPDLTGTYGGGDFENFKLSNIKVDGNTATMDVTLSAQGLELPSTIKLTLDGDKVSGTLDYGQGEATITGKRAPAASFVGTWNVIADSQLGVNKRTLVIKEDMTGTYGGGDFPDFELSDIKVDGNTATMQVTLEFQGVELPSTIKLKLDGNEISGTLDYGMGESTLAGSRE